MLLFHSILFCFLKRPQRVENLLVQDFCDFFHDSNGEKPNKQNKFGKKTYSARSLSCVSFVTFTKIV